MTGPGDRKELHWLEDINEAIEKIESHDQRPSGKEALETDEHYRVWVFYHIERIGECALHLRRDFDYDNKYPEIDWKGAQAMRRHFVHRYWNADKDEVWKGVQYLSKIKEKVDELVKEKTRELGKDEANRRPESENVVKIKQTQKKHERDRDDDLIR